MMQRDFFYKEARSKNKLIIEDCAESELMVDGTESKIETIKTKIQLKIAKLLEKKRCDIVTVGLEQDIPINNCFKDTAEKMWQR